MDTGLPAARETRARRAEWFAAMRWRRRVEAALRKAGLTFSRANFLE